MILYYSNLQYVGELGLHSAGAIIFQCFNSISSNIMIKIVMTVCAITSVVVHNPTVAYNEGRIKVVEIQHKIKVWVKMN